MRAIRRHGKGQPRCTGAQGTVTFDRPLKLAAVVGATMIAGGCRESVAQSAWQPAAGYTQIPIWPNGAPNARRDIGAEAVGFAEDDNGKKRLVGGKPWT